MQRLFLPLLLTSSVALGGCAASIAAGVAGAAMRSAKGEEQPVSGQSAAEACRAHAGQYGEVSIIDVEMRSVGKIVVWGTVQKGQQRHSFECRYDGKIAGFKLRAIQPR
jgi:hypothetical protein